MELSTPPAQLRAARFMGRLLGRGSLSMQECRTALEAASIDTNAAAAIATSGRRTVLWHALRDAAREEARARERAARFVCTALRAGMRAGLDGAALQAAAARAGRGVLDDGEIAVLAAGEIGRSLGRHHC